MDRKQISYAASQFRESPKLIVNKTKIDVSIHKIAKNTILENVTGSDEKIQLNALPINPYIKPDFWKRNEEIEHVLARQAAMHNENHTLNSLRILLDLVYQIEIISIQKNTLPPADQIEYLHTSYQHILKTEKDTWMKEEQAIRKLILCHIRAIFSNIFPSQQNKEIARTWLKKNDSEIKSSMSYYQTQPPNNLNESDIIYFDLALLFI